MTGVQTCALPISKIAKVDPADEQPGSDHGGDDNGISEHIIFTPKGSLYQISTEEKTPHCLRRFY